MKRTLLTLVIMLALCCMAVVFGVPGMAMAEEPITSHIITPGYLSSLGTISHLSALDGTIVTIEETSGRAFVRMVGATSGYFQLDRLASDIRHIQAISTADDVAVLIWYQDATDVLCYTKDGVSSDYVRTSMEVSPLPSYPLNWFGWDSATDTLYLAYDALIAKKSIYATSPEVVTTLDMAHPYDSFTVFGDILTFVKNGAGKVSAFALNANIKTLDETKEVGLAPLLYLPQHGGMILKENSVWMQESLLIGSTTEPHIDNALCDATTWSLDQTSDILYIADNGQRAIKGFDQTGALVSFWGGAGNGVDRLNNPAKMDANQLVAVMDSGNKRVVAYRPDSGYATLQAVGDMHDVATQGNDVYIAGTNGIIHWQVGGTSEVLTVSGYVSAICATGDMVFAVMDGGLYLVDFVAEKVHRQAWFATPITDVVASHHPNMLYIVAGGSISPYWVDTNGGEPISVQIEGESVGVAAKYTGTYYGMQVDKAGNLYVMIGEALVRYTRGLAGYSQEILSIDRPIVDIAQLHTGDTYALWEHALLKVSITNEAPATHVAPAWEAPLSVAQVMDKATAEDLVVWGYTALGNYEAVVKMPYNEYVLYLADTSFEGNQYAYVCTESMGESLFVYLPQNAIRHIADKLPAEDTIICHDGAPNPDGTVNLYLAPYYGAETRRIMQSDAVLKLVRYLADTDDFTWIEVEYDNTHYFVDGRNYIANNPQYPAAKWYTAHAVAGRLGAKIPVYSEESMESEVAFWLVDGAELTMDTPFDKDSELTKVYFENKAYWIPSANVTNSSMTSGQTFAIILSVVVVLATIVTILLYRLVRKKQM